jgi:hypothetical protein
MIGKSGRALARCFDEGLTGDVACPLRAFGVSTVVVLSPEVLRFSNGIDVKGA